MILAKTMAQTMHPPGALLFLAGSALGTAWRANQYGRQQMKILVLSVGGTGGYFDWRLSQSDAESHYWCGPNVSWQHAFVVSNKKLPPFDTLPPK
jgi:hypothetical protein